MQVDKMKCLSCKEKVQLVDAKALFKEGCPLCKSKRVKLLGYGKEEVR